MVVDWRVVDGVVRPGRDVQEVPVEPESLNLLVSIGYPVDDLLQNAGLTGDRGRAGAGDAALAARLDAELEEGRLGHDLDLRDVIAGRIEEQPALLVAGAGVILDLAADLAEGGATGEFAGCGSAR